MRKLLGIAALVGAMWAGQASAAFDYDNAIRFRVEGVFTSGADYQVGGGADLTGTSLFADIFYDPNNPGSTIVTDLYHSTASGTGSANPIRSVLNYQVGSSYVGYYPGFSDASEGEAIMDNALLFGDVDSLTFRIRDTLDDADFKSLSNIEINISGVDLFGRAYLTDPLDLDLSGTNSSGSAYIGFIDKATGQTVTWSEGAFQVTRLWTLSGSTPGIPEPATWAMLIVGFGMVGSMSRRTLRVGIPTR
jgi:hypothetical protein